LYYIFPIIVIFAKCRTPKEQPRGKILLVDDDPGSVKVISWILDQNSYVVRHVRESAKALKEFTKNSRDFQAVIVNARMPGMTGFEFARRAKRHRSEIRIVLLTDFHINKWEFRKVFPSTQIDDIVVKPAAALHLMQAVAGTNNPVAEGDQIAAERLREYQSAL
jgi:two-component SAPR family response regulator